MSARLLTTLLLLPWLAHAAVGKVTALQGAAQRTPTGGAAVALAPGAELELGDQIQVLPEGYVKITLTDQSVLALGPGSRLELTSAEFQGQERKSFAAKLWVGQFWAHVSKALAGSDSKFEVNTDRAVAGVRGTIFRVDAIAVVPRQRQGRAGAASVDRTVVKVTEGKVGVEARIHKRKPGARPPTGPRHEVAGPQEISLEEWEKKFAELQANQQVTVGDSSFDQSSFDPKKKDAFDRFVDKP